MQRSALAPGWKPPAPYLPCIVQRKPFRSRRGLACRPCRRAIRRAILRGFRTGGRRLSAAQAQLSAGLAAGAAAVGSAPPLHCSTYAFSVTPRACMPALSARHSAVHSFAVFAKAGAAEMLHATATAISRPLWIFIFILLIPCLLTRCGGKFASWGNDCSYAATEPRTSGRKETAAAVLFVTPIAFFDKAVFPIRDGLECMRPN